MGRLESGDDSLCTTQHLESLYHLIVGDRLIPGTSDSGKVAVLWPDTRIVQSSADRLGLQHLTELVLHQIGVHTVDHARYPTPHCSAASRLHAHQVGRRVGEA